MGFSSFFVTGLFKNILIALFQAKKKREDFYHWLRAFYTFIALETILPRCNQFLRNSSPCILTIKRPVFGKAL